MKRIRFAVLGCGVIAPTHIWAIDRIENAELTALCDIDRQKMTALAEGRDLFLFEDWKEMLASPEVDAVAICLPHYLHAPALTDALTAGKHVLCEKPMGISLEQLRTMTTAAGEGRKRGLKTGGIFQHRFSPLVGEVNRLLEEGALGTLEEVKVHFLCTRDRDYYGADAWRGKWATEGGGLIINQAIHTIDLLIQLMGMPDRVQNTLYRERLSMIEVEDRSEGIFFYDRGKNGCPPRVKLILENDLATSWQPDIHIKGSRATLVLKGSEEFVCSDPDLAGRLSPFAGEEQAKAPGKACYGSLHGRNYEDFLEAITADREPAVSLESLADSTEAVLALYQSHFMQTTLPVPLTGWKKPIELDFKGEIQ
ncbi:MAG: Gfo/Idh/MocA family oxidoreductase [Spirochaetales bacterium]|nr:Gfo/Idh/MocA family oxidoreductase [Spirochaetales bacterium]